MNATFYSSFSIISIFLLTSCSPSDSELVEKFNSIEDRYGMFMSFEGCIQNITPLNEDESSRQAQLKIVSSILPEAFKYLNSEINFINSVEETRSNKEVLEKYRSKIGFLLSENLKIFRLVFVEQSKNNSDYWGLLSLDGENFDVLRQSYENKTQNAVIDQEIKTLILMRFKKVIMEAPDNRTKEINIQSPLDSELILMN